MPTRTPQGGPSIPRASTSRQSAHSCIVITGRQNPPVWDGTTPLRFKSEPKSYRYHDEVMGDITTSPEVDRRFYPHEVGRLPDLQFCTYRRRRAHADHPRHPRLKNLSHSMPNYLALYEALDVDLPIFAHMPHIMNEQGNKKLGKRDGAKDVLDYIRDGYLPEALDSFIATMGWNDGTEQEVFTMKELVEKFSLARVQRSGARFDEKRLLWMNGHFIRELALDELYERVSPPAGGFWPEVCQESRRGIQETSARTRPRSPQDTA